MKAENFGVLRPCPRCLKARQRIKDIAATVLHGLTAKTLVVYSTAGHWLKIDRATMKVIDCNPTPSRLKPPIVGRTIYLTGTKVLDVATAMPLYWFGNVARIEQINPED